MQVANPQVKRLLNLYQPIATLAEIGEVLDWDMNVNLPPDGAEARGKQAALLTEIATQKWHDQELVGLLSELANDQGLSEVEQAVVRVLDRTSQLFRKVPAKTIIERANITTQSFMAWQQAKIHQDFNEFAPHLEKVVTITREIADKLGYQANPYDALLNLYDQGLTADSCQQTFATLQPALTDLLQRIQRSKHYQFDSPLLSNTINYPEDKQQQLAVFALQRMGYNFQAGRMDIAMHPFSTDLGYGDTRITTRYLSHDFRSSFSAAMHEGGHALYTQGIAKEYADISLEDELSFAIHESQSRFWENQIGRSPEFLAYMTPLFQAFFPEQLGQSDAGALIRLFNQVKPNLIRIEADEVTYCLHIMLRFELENELINNRLKVKDLPEAWNAKVKQYLGIAPANPAEGVLQDVHWSNGYIGYFPSYALGNLYAAQFARTMNKTVNIAKQATSGDLAPVLTWLRTNIHQYGSLYTPEQLVTRITGERLNPHYFIEYLTQKFGQIYELT